MSRIVAVLDSCVLFPNLLRDTLLSMVEGGVYRAHWSPEILDGLTRNLINRQILTPQKAENLEEIMKTYFPDAMVEINPEIVSQMTNHEGDRHVLATAVLADAEVIVTFNLKHFRLEDTITWEVEAQHPDTFLVGLLQKNREEIKAIITRQASRLKKPPLSVEQLLIQLGKQVPQFSQIMLEEVFDGKG